MSYSFPDKPLAQLMGSNGPVHAVSYSASPGTYILAGSADRTIRLYNPFPSQSQTLNPSSNSITKTATSFSSPKPQIPQGRLIQSYSAHGYEVLSLSISPDNERFASSGGDRAVFLWDVATATTTRRFGGNTHGHTSRINDVKFAGEDTSVSNANGVLSPSLVVSGGFDTTVRIWDMRANNPKPIQVLDDAKDAVTSLAVRGAEVLAGSVDGRVRAYDVRAGKCTVDTIGASVTSVDLTRDGRAMLVGSLDSKLRLMDRERGSCLKTYEAPGWRNEELRVQALLGGREKFVVAGDELTATGSRDGDADKGADGGGAGGNTPRDGKVWAWDMLTGKVVATVRVPWGPPGHNVGKKKVLGRDGKEKQRANVISCLAWREDGWGDHFCAGGTSGVVTVYGQDTT